MNLVLVRHGQTEANYEKLIQGWTDNPLNELGIKQSHEIGIFLKEGQYSFDYAYSSPLMRAVKTGEVALSYLNDKLPIIIDYHFMERNFGPFEAKIAHPVLKEVLKEGFTYPGFEDDQMLLGRIETGLLKLYEKHPGKNIVLFCHSHVIKSFLILAEPKNYTYRTFIDNCSLHQFAYDGTDLKLLKFNLTTKKKHF